MYYSSTEQIQGDKEMKSFAPCFVALARIADHEAAIYHRLGDRDEEEHARQLQRHYMDAARKAKTNQPK